MTHYDARQESSTGRWHYTSARGRDVHAIGHCSTDGGHDTAAEARECYRGWLVEHANFKAITGEPRACAVPGCGEPTDMLAIPPLGAYAHLCEDHCNPLGLSKVFPPVGSFFTS